MATFLWLTAKRICLFRCYSVNMNCVTLLAVKFKMYSSFPFFVFGCCTDELSIDIDNPNPLHVANCTPVKFVCRLNSTSERPSTNPVEVYWSFRGENASKLPGVNTTFDGHLASLHIPCPERNYSGVYQCLAEEKNTSIIYKKELNFNVYGKYINRPLIYSQTAYYNGYIYLFSIQP